MRHLSITLYVLIFIIWYNALGAQTNVTRKNSIQFDYGISVTFHYNPPVNLNACDEGCFTEEQESRISSNASIGFYRKLNDRNALKLGVGLSEYRYWEKGSAGSGGGSLYPFEDIYELKYYNFSFGFKHLFYAEHIIMPFIETEFILELPDETYNLTENYGIANKSQVGATIEISNRWSANLGAFFKTGIMNYKKSKRYKSYVPYGYGIQIGLNFKI